ncbi:MAG: ABC transporter substrate binding protein [Planctomycetota bacterium]|nr:ABC transporter substrate binding protein [Planctomycetota bacterium]
MLTCWVQAADVTIVLTSDAKPYRTAAESATAALKQNGFTAAVQIHGAALPSNTKAILAVGSQAAIDLAEAPQHPPLLYCMVGAPLHAQLLASGKATGVAVEVPIRQQFALISRLQEGQSIGMLYHSESTSSRARFEAARAHLPADWALMAVDLDQSTSVSAAIDDLLRQQPAIIWTAADTAVYDATTVRALLLASLRQHTPVFGFSPAFARAGAIVGLEVTPEDQGRQAASLVIDTLTAKGDAGLPAAPDPVYVYHINTIVANKLRMRIPQDVLDQAAQLIGQRR